jgi:hypothetical protein
MDQGKLAYYTKPRQKVPTYSQVLEEVSAQRAANIDKNPHYVNAIDKICDEILGYIDEHGLSENEKVSEDFVHFLDQMASQTVEQFKVNEKSGVYAWATTRGAILDVIKKGEEELTQETSGLTAEKIRELLEDETTKLVCVSISDPYAIKNLAIELTRNLLIRRKRRFVVKPYILLVFDEAQEFIPNALSGLENKISSQVETLLRQGRKYGLGVCIATQRVAYLNTNALQQLHTYFVGTLPRPYDRNLISETFMVDKSILEKTLEFAPGEWMVSSYIATGMENVPIFIKADNAEKEIEKYLSNESTEI